MCSIFPPGASRIHFGASVRQVGVLLDNLKDVGPYDGALEGRMERG
jgi:hypothetical protein